MGSWTETPELDGTRCMVRPRRVQHESRESLFEHMATCPQGTWNGDLSHHLSEVQASQTQVDPSTLVPSCLRKELDQGIHFCKDFLNTLDPVHSHSSSQAISHPGAIG
ncbi:hypothetical protein P7K49_016422 [Saguinus oedipus]|uniref:Uncharacterized protein n=1 Tax=Saguinus oedipus TaxID=9490 RepID=A0ABQ9VC14_SAGOE|nr:hypothetical protein P7K49_016422 [Saguinus oedipus]